MVNKENKRSRDQEENIGQGSWSLPRNVTSLKKTKYEFCEQF